MTYYPEIDEQSLTIIKRMVDQDPSYITNPECPYGDIVRDIFLVGAEKAKDFDAPVNTFSTGRSLSDSEVEKQVNDLYQKIIEYGEEVKFSDNSSDKNTFFRISASLLEKLVKMRQDMDHVKNVNKFIREVILIMDDTLNADQRADVMKRLEEIIGKGNILQGGE